MTQVTIAEAQRRLPELLSAAEAGETVTIRSDEGRTWYVQRHGAMVQEPVGEDGLYRSTVFPGLWLDPVALLNGDTRQLRAIVDLGCAAPEHAAFLARLAGRPGSF